MSLTLNPSLAAPLQNLLQAGDKLLVIAASHTGNNIFCTPAIRLLRRLLPAQCAIDVLALNKLSAEVFIGNTDLSTLIVDDSKRRLRKLLAHYKYAICLNEKSMEHFPEASNLLCIGHDGQGLHHAEQTLQFVASLLHVTLADSDRAYVMAEPPHAEQGPAGFIQRGHGDIFVGLHLGCGRTAIHGWKFFYGKRASHRKLWPLEDYIALGQQLCAANPRIKLVISGTKNESFLGKEFMRAVPNSINLIGKTTATDLYAVFNKLDLFISQDCGVLHIAAASQAPLLGLFGPTNPASTGPYPASARHHLIKKSAMDEIRPSEVATAALQLLAHLMKA